MKKLSDFKDEQALNVVNAIIPPIMELVSEPKNREVNGEKNLMEVFGAFLKNTPKAMMSIFAILNEEDPKDYHCDGLSLMQNLMQLVSDKEFIQLFTSQKQKGDATSSAPALENAK